MTGQAAHESFDREESVKMGSDRGFGYVFTVVFLIIACIKYFAGQALEWVLVWSALAVLTLGIALFVPKALRPFNIIWFRFGLLLHRVVNPIIMGLMFFVAVTPVGLLMRMFNARPLSLKFDPDAESYWIPRSPPGPAPGSFTNQF